MKQRMKNLTEEKSENFEYIWDNWIIPLSYKIMNDMDKEFCDFCGVQLRETKLEEIKSQACVFYLKKRKALKSEYYGEDYNSDTTEKHRMDFHKLSAIFCRTLIEYKLFDFDIEKCEEYIQINSIKKTDTDWLVKNALVNFRMAFYSSVVLLYNSMLFKYSTQDTVVYRNLQNRKNLDLYNNSQKDLKKCKVHESFENCIVLDLAKRDINNRSFDYLMYAITMYQLEEYNRRLLIQSDPYTPIEFST